MSLSIVLRGTQLVLRFPPDRDILAKVRSLPSRRFDAAEGAWLVPYTTESWRALRLLGFDLGGLPAPTASGYAVDVRDGLLQLSTPYSPRNVELCRAIPDHHMWHAESKTWLCKATPRTVAYLKATFPEAAWSAPAQQLLIVAEERIAANVAATATLQQEKAAIGGADAIVTDYKFGGPAPFVHQRRAFLLSRDRPAFALLMEQGTGKSKVIVDTAAWLFTRGRIVQVLVIAPNSVKTNWVTDEIPIHTPDYVRYRAAYWGGGTIEHRRQIAAVLEGDEPEILRWFVVNVEALSAGRGADAVEAFIARGPTLVVIDESSRIKTPGARRTRAAIRLGRHPNARFRRICTGTPITQGPLDAWAQFRFLDPDVLFGYDSFSSFRTHFAILGGFNNRVVVAYAHLDELQRLIEPHAYRVLRADCLDLPPKIYQKIEVDLAEEQRRIYVAMRDQMVAELAGEKKVTATIVLTQLLRLQQITGGFVPAELVRVADNGIPIVLSADAEPIPGPNPKLEALLELADDVVGKVIVWARFRAELDLIAHALREKYGSDAVVEFHGGVKDDDRILARTAFQDAGSPVRFFVGQTETGGLGLTLTQAKTVVYYSNSFSLESRLQSEDRAHRIGQTGSVTYVDLVARETVDLKVIGALRAKQALATSVTGDKWRDWI